MPIHNASEINGIFDAITYDKGAAVLRMLQTYLSPRVFQVCVTLQLNLLYYGIRKALNYTMQKGGAHG